MKGSVASRRGGRHRSAEKMLAASLRSLDDVEMAGQRGLREALAEFFRLR